MTKIRKGYNLKIITGEILVVCLLGSLACVLDGYCDDTGALRIPMGGSSRIQGALKSDVDRGKTAFQMPKTPAEQKFLEIIMKTSLSSRRAFTLDDYKAISKKVAENLEIETKSLFEGLVGYIEHGLACGWLESLGSSESEKERYRITADGYLAYFSSAVFPNIAEEQVKNDITRNGFAWHNVTGRKRALLTQVAEKYGYKLLKFLADLTSSSLYTNYIDFDRYTDEEFIEYFPELASFLIEHKTSSLRLHLQL